MSSEKRESDLIRWVVGFARISCQNKQRDTSKVSKSSLAVLGSWDRNVVLLEWCDHDGNIQQFICGNPVNAMGTLA